MPDHAATLRAVPLFGHLDEDRLAHVLGRSAVRAVAAGTTLAVRGAPAERLLVVESGALTAVRETADGHRLRLGEFPAPCTVDKAAVLGAGRHTATWSAAARARIRLVPAADLFRLIDWLARAATRPGDRVLLPGAQAGLAETLGASRVSVNRALRDLSRAGLVRTEPGAVVVLDPGRLARRAATA
jgi:CRP/FNR family cyclic AMP-dependent transcriptional regulator